MSHTKNFPFILGLAISLFFCPWQVNAAPESPAENNVVKNRVEKPVRDSITTRQQTQRQREKWLDERDRMLKKLEQLENDNQELTAEQERLSSQVNGARERIARKEKELEGIRRIPRDILPFLQETMSWLDSEINSSLPFLPKERRDRLERLAELMDAPDVSIAEKLRKIMEALLIEAEYGTTVEVANESVELDKEPVLVTCLRLGRLNLFYQTLDESGCGFYNTASGKWEELPRRYDRNIKMTVDMALKHRPVELVNLPVGRVEVR